MHQSSGRRVQCWRPLTSLVVGFVALAGCSAGDETSDDVTLGVSADALSPASCSSTQLVPVSASASSVENANFGPEFAIDGNPSTRWSSAFSDPQWITIDLGTLRYVDRVALSWETASSAIYDVQVSTDGSFWTTVHHQVGGQVGPLDATFDALGAAARYVRIHSERRTTIWGNSLFEVEIYGDQNPDCATKTYRIDSVHSGKSIDVSEISTADLANIHQWDYVGGANQQWSVVPKGAGEFELRNVNSGKCLDVGAASQADGANVLQWPCDGYAKQRFRFHEVGDQIEIVAVHSGKCLDVQDFSLENGGNIQQWTCYGTPNQRWTLSPLDDVTPSSNRRPWAMYDANGDHAWNWSTLLSSGGSEIMGTPAGDIQAFQDHLMFPFNHNGTGYAEASITSSFDPNGIEPTSAAERDAGKPVDPSGHLSLVHRANHELFAYRVKLRDAHGNEGASVRPKDYYHHCSILRCNADIPLSDLAGNGLDFDAIQSVTVFVDDTVPAGYQTPVLSQIVFTTPDDPVDLENDPRNCGEIGKSCGEGPCQDGVCQAALVVNDLVCGSGMAADEEHIYLGDLRTTGDPVRSIFRYDADGRNRSEFISDAGFTGDIRRDQNQLFWTGAPNGLQRYTDGDSSSEILFPESAFQMQLTDTQVVFVDPYEQQVLAGDRFGDSDSVHVIADIEGTYPMATAATNTHFYFVWGSSTVTEVVAVDLATGDKSVVDSARSIFGIWSYGDAVYYSYRTAAGINGIRRSFVGGATEETVPPVGDGQGYGNPFVDESGIYHSYYDGSTNGFYRTAHGNPNDRVLLTRTLYPYQAPVVFTDDSILFMNSCSRGGPGNVHRLLKP